jgi:hypothetical protein
VAAIKGNISVGITVDLSRRKVTIDGYYYVYSIKLRFQNLAIS